MSTPNPPAAPDVTRVLAALIYAIAALVGTALVWAALTTVPEIVRAEGQIVPMGELRAIEHFDGGVVERVAVAPGDRVTAGATLVVVEPPRLRLELAGIEAEIAQAEQRLMRLAALQSLLAGEAAADPPDHYVATRHALHDERLRALRQGVVHREASLTAAREVQRSALSRRELAAERQERARSLQERGLISERSLADQLDAAERIEAELLELDLRVLDAEGRYHEASAALSEAQISIREELVRQEDEALTELDQLGVRRDELRRSLGRAVVRAPVDGVIQAVSVTAPGQVIAPGGPVATLVASDDALVARVRLSPRDIGHVRPDDEARIKVTTFDARRYGDIAGRVAVISPTSEEDETGTSFFEATVVLETDAIGTGPSRRPIRAGMEVTVEMISRQRTVLFYFLKPIDRILNTSFGER